MHEVLEIALKNRNNAFLSDQAWETFRKTVPAAERFTVFPNAERGACIQDPEDFFELIWLRPIVLCCRTEHPNLPWPWSVNVPVTMLYLPDEEPLTAQREFVADLAAYAGLRPQPCAHSGPAHRA